MTTTTESGDRRTRRTADGRVLGRFTERGERVSSSRQTGSPGTGTSLGLKGDGSAARVSSSAITRPGRPGAGRRAPPDIVECRNGRRHQIDLTGHRDLHPLVVDAPVEKPARRRADLAVSVSVFRSRTTRSSPLTLHTSVSRNAGTSRRRGADPPGSGPPWPDRCCPPVVGRLGQAARFGPKQCEHLVGHLVPGELRRPLAGSRSPLPPRSLHRPPDGALRRSPGARSSPSLDQPAGLPVADGVAQARSAVGQNRDPDGVGLDDRKAPPLPLGGIHRQPRRAQDQRSRSDELTAAVDTDVILEPEDCDQRLDGRPLRAVPDQMQLDVGEFGQQRWNRLDDRGRCICGRPADPRRRCDSVF